MLKKNLSKILGQFTKVQRELQTFIDLEAKASSARAISISQLEEANESSLRECARARHSLSKIEEIVGE